MTDYVHLSRRNRPATDFQTAANEHGITRCYERPCSICGYITSFIIDGDNVAFDPGCYCTGCAPLQPRTWEDIAGMYNMQTVEQVQQRHDEFWQFGQEQ